MRLFNLFHQYLKGIVFERKYAFDILSSNAMNLACSSDKNSFKKLFRHFLLVTPPLIRQNESKHPEWFILFSQPDIQKETNLLVNFPFPRTPKYLFSYFFKY